MKAITKYNRVLHKFNASGRGYKLSDTLYDIVDRKLKKNKYSTTEIAEIMHCMSLAWINGKGL